MDGGGNEEDFMQQQDRQQRPRPPEAQHGGARHDLHQAPPPPPRCPRCDSSNTKFCYYNNYSLSQPRYYCKSCRRYWTHGGTLRNVPVGGGCRKSKRPRISSPSRAPSSLSSRGLVPRAQNLGGVPGQPSRPVAPPSGGAYFAGGSFLSSLAAMQSLPAAAINREAAAMGGGGRFGANMALLQGMAFQALKSPAPPPPQQSRPQTTHLFPPPQNLIPPGAFGSWNQSVANSDATSSSAAPAGDRWSSNSAAAAVDRAGSSFTANQWSDCNPGVNPSE